MYHIYKPYTCLHTDLNIVHTYTVISRFSTLINRQSALHEMIKIISQQNHLYEQNDAS